MARRRKAAVKTDVESKSDGAASTSDEAATHNGRHVTFGGAGAMANGAAPYYLAPSGRGMRSVPSVGTLNRLARQKIVLWRAPITTLQYFCYEAAFKLTEAIQSLWSHRRLVALAVCIAAALSAAYVAPGPHQNTVQYFEKKMLWSLYWVGLGVLSSVGFGTGLHTFLLYLGPHIASVTLAAYECDSLAFPQPPYPDEIVCPFEATAGGGALVSLWAIISKVRLESFMWGAGTALGELPPYFMARAARLSGEEPDDPEYREFMQFMRAQNEGQPQELHWMDRVKLVVEKLVERVGFLGILLCASIPNPAFDLAGITCGHFLVPFWTFFGATLIGKAIVKMHIQKIFVILTFSEHHVEKMVHMLRYIPRVGKSLQAPFKDWLQQQKAKLHRRPGQHVAVKGSWLGDLFGAVVVLMIVYFLLSIVNSLAQAYHKRVCSREQQRHRTVSR